MQARRWLARTAQRWTEVWLGDADPRAYALVRISIGSVYLGSLCQLWAMRSDLLGPQGLLDLITVARDSDPLAFSLFFLAPSEGAVTWLFAAAMLASLALILGAFSRWPAVLLWVFAVSVDYRAQMMTSGADQLLRCFLFLLMISPITKAWSVDCWWRRRSGRTLRAGGWVPRYGLVLMQLQVFVIYYQTVWIKLPDHYWRNGELISYFMMSMYSRFPSPAWAEWELLSSVLTYATIGIELAVPWLLWSRRGRWAGFVLGWGLHASIAVVSILHLFSAAIMSTYFCYLERHNFERLARWRPGTPQVVRRS